MATTFTTVTPYPLIIKPILQFTAYSDPEVDLRPRIHGLGLTVRDQNPRGTCSVFALTFPLEFMSLTRRAVTVADLSEEYLNYVSNLVVNDPADGGFFHDLDAGYQKFGIVPEQRVPYQPSPIATVDQAVLDEGVLWTRFVADFIKPWDASKGADEAQIQRVIACLNDETPVAIGAWWPDAEIAGTTEINGVDLMNVPPESEKKTDSNPNGRLKDGHSVVLVGYRRHGDFPGGGYFVFRNSWGPTWGDDGYGYMPFEYVRKYANDLLAYRLKTIISKGLGPSAVTARSDRIDLVVADSSGEIHAAAWQQGVLNGRWRGWWSIRGGRSTPGAAITVVSRAAGKLDVFATGQDGKIYTAASDAAIGNGQWRGWWPITTGAAPAGSTVAAVARDAEKLDTFVVGNDGGIYTAAWDQKIEAGKWRGWWRIGTLQAKPGTPVSAVSRAPGKLDLVVTGADGKIYTAAWDQNVEAGKWRGWWPITTGAAPAGSRVAAVARDAEKLDVFVVGNDGGIYTAAWDQKIEAGKWRGWWRIGTLQAKPGTPVSAVSRAPGKLDAFVTGADGKIYTAAWDQNVEAAKWRGWWPITTGAAPAGSAVAAVARDAEKLDAFVVGNDGGIYTAAWDQKIEAGKWRGWWRIG